jgi:hypothetical protein
MTAVACLTEIALQADSSTSFYARQDSVSSTVMFATFTPRLWRVCFRASILISCQSGMAEGETLSRSAFFQILTSLTVCRTSRSTLQLHSFFLDKLKDSRFTSQISNTQDTMRASSTLFAFAALLTPFVSAELHSDALCVDKIGGQTVYNEAATTAACIAYRNRNTGGEQWDTCPDCVMVSLARKANLDCFLEANTMCRKLSAI